MLQVIHEAGSDATEARNSGSRAKKRLDGRKCEQDRWLFKASKLGYETFGEASGS
jgi:hypothetical protein